MTTALTLLNRMPRRGELDGVLHPDARRILREMYGELEDLRRRALVLNDDFLAMLIATAADETRDQLRDDLIMREAAPPEAGESPPPDAEADYP